MNGYDMVYLIEETIEYGQPDFDGNYVVITYYLPYYQYREYGISEIKVILERDYYYGHVYYEVVTAYPTYGPDVAVYPDHHWVN